MAEKPEPQTVTIDTAGDESTVPTSQPMSKPPTEATTPDTSGLTVGKQYATETKVDGEPGTFVGKYTGARTDTGKVGLLGQASSGRNVIRWADPKGCNPIDT